MFPSLKWSQSLAFELLVENLKKYRESKQSQQVQRPGNYSVSSCLEPINSQVLFCVLQLEPNPNAHLYVLAAMAITCHHSNPNALCPAAGSWHCAAAVESTDDYEHYGAC